MGAGVGAEFGYKRSICVRFGYSLATAFSQVRACFLSLVANVAIYEIGIVSAGEKNKMVVKSAHREIKVGKYGYNGYNGYKRGVED